MLVVLQVHLVDGENQFANAEGRRDEGVTACLLKNTAAGVNQQDSEVSRRCACRHVPCVLNVTRRICDDELTLVSREEAVGYVDRNALLTFGCETVNKKREVDVLALCTNAFGIGLKRVQLIFEDHLGIVEHTTDERRFAVVY